MKTLKNLLCVLSFVYVICFPVLFHGSNILIDKINYLYVLTISIYTTLYLTKKDKN